MAAALRPVAGAANQAFEGGPTRPALHVRCAVRLAVVSDLDERAYAHRVEVLRRLGLCRPDVPVSLRHEAAAGTGRGAVRRPGRRASRADGGCRFTHARSLFERGFRI